MKRVYLIAVIVALGAGVITFLFAQSLVDNSKVENAPTTQVVMSTVDIPAGTMITNEMIQSSFTSKLIINADLTVEAVTSTEQLIGKVAAQDIYANEQISMKRIVEQGSDDTALSYSLEEGEVAYSITAGSVQGVDGYITPGDTVDILVPVASTDGQVTGAEILFENLYVIKVATYSEVSSAKADTTGDGEVKTYASLTVKTTDAQAAELYKMESSGTGFKFILNSRIDTEKALATQ